MEDLKSKENDVEKTNDAETEVKDNIVDRTFEMVKEFAHKGRKKITERIEQIDRELDLDRVIHLNLATIALAGAALCYATADKRWLLMPACAAGLLIADTLTGITGKIPLLKKLGLRLKNEILHERYALKAFRGDFKHTDSPEIVWDNAV
jgi:hypothetical protein